VDDELEAPEEACLEIRKRPNERRECQGVCAEDDDHLNDINFDQKRETVNMQNDKTTYFKHTTCHYISI